MLVSFFKFFLTFSLLSLGTMKSTSAMECLNVPPWLENLLSTPFFSLCKVHSKEPRNDCKMYCLDCNDQASCVYCVESSHKNHRVIQIRRSSYHDVVRVLEIQQALNLNGVQTYVINSSRVIFLNTRAPNNQHKPKNAGRISAKNNTKCVICTRNLVDPFCFCSLECKLVWTKKSESESFAIEGMPRTMLSQEEEEELRQRIHRELCERRCYPEASSNSKRRKGIPRRAAC